MNPKGFPKDTCDQNLKKTYNILKRCDRIKQSFTADLLINVSYLGHVLR